LQVHDSRVRRVLARARFCAGRPSAAPSQIDTYLLCILRTLVDWGHFGCLEIGCERLLAALAMALTYSRQIFLRFFPDARMEN